MSLSPNTYRLFFFGRKRKARNEIIALLFVCTAICSKIVFSIILNIRHLYFEFFNRCVSKFDNQLINSIRISSVYNKFIYQIIQTVDKPTHRKNAEK